MRPDISCSVAKHALPITRFNIMRPATATLIAWASSSSLDCAVLRVQVGGERIAAKVVGIGVSPRAQRRQLAAPLGDDLVFVAGAGADTGVVVRRNIPTLPASGSPR